MNHDKITEFVTVLIFAMIVGGGASLSILYLEGVARDVALGALIVIAVVAWQFLRRRFGRA